MRCLHKEDVAKLGMESTCPQPSWLHFAVGGVVGGRIFVKWPCPGLPKRFKAAAAASVAEKTDGG